MANPQDAQVEYFLSCAKIAFGDLDGVLELARRAVSLEPNNSKYHQQLALVYGRRANKSFVLQEDESGRPVLKDEVKKAVELDAKNWMRFGN